MISLLHSFLCSKNIGFHCHFQKQSISSKESSIFLFILKFWVLRWSLTALILLDSIVHHVRGSICDHPEIRFPIEFVGVTASLKFSSDSSLYTLYFSVLKQCKSTLSFTVLVLLVQVLPLARTLQVQVLFVDDSLKGEFIIIYSTCRRSRYAITTDVLLVPWSTCIVNINCAVLSTELLREKYAEYWTAPSIVP